MGEATFHRRRWILAIIGVPVIVLLVLMSGLVGWSDLNSVHYDVDISTGRIRRTRYLFYCNISENIEDSVITKALPPDRLSIAQPEWHRVNTFCGVSRVSPHHGFHGTLGDLRMLAEAQSWISFTDEAKQQVAERVLQLWRSSNRDYDAGEYIMAVYQKADEFHVNGKASMDLAELPGDQEQKEYDGDVLSQTDMEWGDP